MPFVTIMEYNHNLERRDVTLISKCVLVPNTSSYHSIDFGTRPRFPKFRVGTPNRRYSTRKLFTTEENDKLRSKSLLLH